MEPGKFFCAGVSDEAKLHGRMVGPMRTQRTYVTTLLIVLNVLVFGAWQGWYGPGEAFMARNFLVSWDLLSAGAYWDLLTSVFSHNWTLHLILNMFVLNSFGRFLEGFLGWKFYLGFYLVAGIVSSLSHAVVSNYLMGTPELPALGASGSLAGLILLFSLIFPKEKIVLFGIIPVPALIGALAFVGLDIWGLVSQVEGGGLPIGHGAHLGGSLTGLLTYFLVVKPRLRRQTPEFY
jgi:membrane associated rhomboid family serine protease